MNTEEITNSKSHTVADYERRIDILNLLREELTSQSRYKMLEHFRTNDKRDFYKEVHAPLDNAITAVFTMIRSFDPRIEETLQQYATELRKKHAERDAKDAA
jgi:hypothetical protein